MSNSDTSSVIRRLLFFTYYSVLDSTVTRFLEARDVSSKGVRNTKGRGVFEFVSMLFWKSHAVFLSLTRGFK